MQSDTPNRTHTAPQGLFTNDLEQAISTKAQSKETPLDNAPSPIKLPYDELPLNWPPLKKWSITTIVALMTGSLTFCSSIHAVAAGGVAETFGVPLTISNLGITTFCLGFGTGPLLFAPMSEVFGRQLIFRINFFLFFCFNVGCALAPNITSVLVLRFLAGAFGGPVVTNGGGVLADIWSQSQRSVPFALYTTGSCLGPIMSPVVGSFVAQYLTWRWHYWLVTIISGTLYILILLLPETYLTVLLERKSLASHSPPPRKSIRQQYTSCLARPWIMLSTEPILITLSLYSACLWGILYLDFTAYPIVFRSSRHWSEGIAGLSFIGIGIGVLAATLSSPLLDAIHATYVLELGGPVPEARLPHLILLSWLIPVSLFWFGWTATNPEVHWAVSLSSGVIFGFPFTLLFLGTNAYLTDCYGRFAASALAANAVLRSCLSGVFPLFAKGMYKELGTPWASSTLAFITLGMAPVPWLLYRYGPWLRARSKYHLWTVELEREDKEGSG